MDQIEGSFRVLFMRWLYSKRKKWLLLWRSLFIVLYLHKPNQVITLTLPSKKGSPFFLFLYFFFLLPYSICAITHSNTHSFFLFCILLSQVKYIFYLFSIFRVNIYFHLQISFALYVVAKASFSLSFKT